MGKRLEDMSLEELWELFPVTLVPYDPVREKWAGEESKYIARLLYAFSPEITHIGSTAIPGIMTKPVVDILVEVSPDAGFGEIKRTLVASGYILMGEDDRRMSFNKGYTPRGYAERVFHVHVRNAGDRDEVIFRDYLRAHPEAARAYEKLKLSLLPGFRNDRDGYTRAKSGFVASVLSRAISDT